MLSTSGGRLCAGVCVHEIRHTKRADRLRAERCLSSFAVAHVQMSADLEGRLYAL